MRYCAKGMSWKEIYDVIRLKKYFLADTELMPWQRETHYIIFDDKQEMMNMLTYDVARIIPEQTSRITGFLDDNGKAQVKSIACYRPELEWLNKTEDED